MSFGTAMDNASEDMTPYTQVTHTSYYGYWECVLCMMQQRYAGCSKSRNAGHRWSRRLLQTCGASSLEESLTDGDALGVNGTQIAVL